MNIRIYIIEDGMTIDWNSLTQEEKKKYQRDLTVRHFMHLDISRKIHRTEIISLRRFV